jgi:hypothetical protein
MFKSIFLNVTCANVMLFSSFVLRPAPPLCPPPNKKQNKKQKQKNYQIIWLYRLLTLKAKDEDYSRNAVN